MIFFVLIPKNVHEIIYNCEMGLSFKMSGTTAWYQGIISTTSGHISSPRDLHKLQ